MHPQNSEKEKKGKTMCIECLTCGEGNQSCYFLMRFLLTDFLSYIIQQFDFMTLEMMKLALMRDFPFSLKEQNTANVFFFKIKVTAFLFITGVHFLG